MPIILTIIIIRQMDVCPFFIVNQNIYNGVIIV